MPRVFKLLSVALHAIVIGGVILAQFLDLGPLPSPRSLLAFTDRVVKLVDIPLPAPPRMASRAAPPLSSGGAPIEPPPTIAPETPRDPVASGPVSSVDLGAVENGTGPIPGGLPGGEVVAPPPPPPPKPTPPMRLHSGMQAPRKIVNVSPIYPALAQAARKGGLVVLEAVIGVTGRVESVRVLKSVPLLDEAATDAVQQWRFTPALLNGVPVPVVMTVTVNFNPQ